MGFRLEESEIPKFLARENLYDELPCGFLSFTPEGTLFDINQTLADWIGQSPEQLRAIGFKALLSKASLLYYNLFLEPLLQIEDLAEEINLKFTSRAGTFDALFSGKSYKNSTGKTLLINATILKISNRKKYESELRLEKRSAEIEQDKLKFLINLVPIQIWTADPSGKLLSINLQVRNYFGDATLDRGTEFLGIVEEDRASAKDAWESSVQSGKLFEREVRFLGISGQPEWFLLRGEPYYNEDVIEMWFCCSININKKKLLQLANQLELKSHLSNAYTNLDHKEARLSAIAFYQSHMVRKPLANILGLIELVNDKQEQEELSAIMELLFESVQELDIMVKNITNDIL